MDLNAAAVMYCFSSQLVVILLLMKAVCFGFKSHKVTSQLFHNQQETGFTNNTRSCSLPWKYDKYDNSSCVCGESIHDIVLCSDDQPTVSLLTCHCMSYSDNGKDVLVGDCPYLCTSKFYTEISEHTDMNELCNDGIRLNRQGQMCGKCFDNFAPSPYSYSFQCSNCTGHERNWIKYVTVALLCSFDCLFLCSNYLQTQCNVSFSKFICSSQPDSFLFCYYEYSKHLHPLLGKRSR